MQLDADEGLVGNFLPRSRVIENCFEVRNERNWVSSLSFRIQLNMRSPYDP